MTAKPARIESIDLLRGIVMILMALDHVRDYFHFSAYQYNPLDLARTTAPIFLTRWITHFCAPIFMLLAGVSAHLYGLKRSKAELSRFLLTRGVWLIFLELFIVTVEWTFNPLFNFYILQVIWAFGVSMIVMAGLIRLPLWAILSVGIVLVAGHNTLDGIHVPGDGARAYLWSFLHDQRFFDNVAMGYPIIPWIGIMALGYALGSWYAPSFDAARRRRNLLYTGFAALLAFVLIRWTNVYGDPQGWSVQKTPLFTLLSFVNVTKYPPSLLYCLLTLGPALIFLAVSERPVGAFGQKILVFGRVPLFYYLVHIFVVHALAVIGAMICGYPWGDMTMIRSWVTNNASLRGYGFNLLTVYVIWIGVVLALYPLCRWYDAYKRGHKKWWLSYM
ncbi:DUF1624 domain-containing protein [Dinghuibacter silviterrae]|uniref:Putative membrane protein n=1 Tax=Dinghuibacter silviterrae TaxID=1539049 RepID=A0A4V3GLR7_9BACT|nr:heparan-alpha-glucosaminide N-acetyltransferase domain-containing protein [Dinghuibacter silviterrae]TDX00613.1 putative membrane protein [Dinghuibacter silviterrae]